MDLNLQTHASDVMDLSSSTVISQIERASCRLQSSFKLSATTLSSDASF